MDALQNFIRRVMPIEESSLKKIIELATIKKLEKNEFLVKEGTSQNEFYILKSGIARSYYLDLSGKSHVRNFFFTTRTIGDIGALISNKPSSLNFDCLTTCEFYVFNHSEFMKLVAKDIHLGKLYQAILENIVLLFQNKIYELSVLDATERYLKLKNDIPEIENLVPQYTIASYLNVTAVQLSRIRKKLLHH